MSIEMFEVMRAATDRRNTVWAAAMAASARREGSDVREEVAAAIRSLAEAGDIVLGTAVWSGGEPQPLAPQEIEAALAEDRQWLPRRLPWARRLRLYATPQGEAKYAAGEFGTPSPITATFPDARVAYELQGLTLEEAASMALAVVGFFAGSVGGYAVVQLAMGLPLSQPGFPGVTAWMFGGALGLILLPRTLGDITPSPKPDSAAIVPDMYNEGPDFTAIDRLGDPRF